MLRTFRETLAAVIRQYSVVATAEKDVTGSVSGTSSKSVGEIKRKIEKVLHCFKKAVDCVKKWDHEPSLKLVREVLKLLEEQCNIESAEEFLVIMREAGHVSTEIYNSLLLTCANSGKMPLIVAELMAKDNVLLDEETHKLIEITSKMCVNELSS